MTLIEFLLYDAVGDIPEAEWNELLAAIEGMLQ